MIHTSIIHGYFCYSRVSLHWIKPRISSAVNYRIFMIEAKELKEVQRTVKEKRCAERNRTLCYNCFLKKKSQRSGRLWVNIDFEWCMQNWISTQLNLKKTHTHTRAHKNVKSNSSAVKSNICFLQHNCQLLTKLYLYRSYTRRKKDLG